VKTSLRILVSLGICTTLGFSGIVSGVSIVINKEPITLYEVYKYSKKLNISKREAIDFLVRQKLEEAQIKKLDISVDPFELDEYINKLATQNGGMSQYEFLNMLKSKGIDIDRYKKELKEKLKREKLYSSILRDKLKPISPKELEEFYKKNIDQFKIANRFDVVLYSSKDKKSLEIIRKNPMQKPQGVEVKSTMITPKDLNPQLNSLLNSTKKGDFTPIVTLNSNPAMFYIKSKGEFKVIPFDSAKRTIQRVLSQQKEQEILKDYFEKLKANANIVVVRQPT